MQIGTISRVLSARLSRLSAVMSCDAVLSVRFIAVVNRIIAAIINANFPITIHIDLEISIRAILRRDANNIEIERTQGRYDL